MEVDSAFLDPIKEFHPVLRAVEMPQAELAKMIPLRINQFSLVRYPYVEPFGFPIDMPEVSGDQLVSLHVKFFAQVAKRGAINATIAAERLLTVDEPLYNKFAVLEYGGEKILHRLVSSDGGEPVVIYDGEVMPLRTVERHINALAIYCNAMFHDPRDFKSDLLESFLSKDFGYEVDGLGRLLSRGKIHGRWTYETARDLLFTCIVNYMRL